MRVQVISEHATALLRNLTAYNAEIKMRAFEAGCLKPAVALLRSRERVVLQNAVATIRNLSFHPEVKVRLVEDGAISSLVGLLNSQDPEVQEHAAAALRNIFPNESSRPSLLESSGQFGIHCEFSDFFPS